MTKLYLIHGWEGSPNSEPWFEWLREECLKKDIELIAPEMPETNYPKIDAWVSKLKEVAEDKLSGDFFVGHSVGCQVIIRYLSEEEGEDLFNLVLVAPWTKLDEKAIEEEGSEGLEIAEPWISKPINFENAKKRIKRSLAIFSDDDPYVPLSETETFEKKLGSEIVVKNGQGHFNETKEIPEIIKFIDEQR